VGIDKMLSLDFGASGIAATATNAATTIVCPAYPGVIWRVNVAYDWVFDLINFTLIGK